MIIVCWFARINPFTNAVLTTLCNEGSVAFILANVECSFLFLFALHIGMQDAHLFPHLRWSGHSPERSLDLGREGSPSGQKQNDGQNRHTGQTPNVFDLRLWIIASSGAQDRGHPAKAKHDEIGVCLVDARETTRAAGFGIKLGGIDSCHCRGSFGGRKRSPALRNHGAGKCGSSLGFCCR